ncbi:zinc ABC transporter substrate-binding protein [Arhodomonas sp. KWT2]|uniref:zinc ABC transporter substrate-binding protein n=1 Tax=Arhodomonas sp. KWT2 TaxID=3344194 RepID=UPI0035C2414F
MSAYAAVPSVAVDIPPVYSLVDRVMGDLGSPELVIQQGASPHRYSMRPSEAAAMEHADAVFWVSEDLTPWFEGPLESLAGDALSVELMSLPGVVQLEYREGPTFDSHGHDHEDHAHEHEHEHEHEHHADGGHHHDHHGSNPHGWLDPANAVVWLDAIADTLAKADPEHAGTYRENARRSKADIKALSNELEAQLVDAKDVRFVVFHDAYQYFENRFDVSAVGAISLGDASQPSPARVDELRNRVVEQNVDCVFSEPQFNPQLVKSVFGGTGANTSIVIDPLGTDLPLDGELYPQLLRKLANAVSECAQTR